MPKPPLNDEQAGIIREKQVTLNRPAGDLIALLAPIAKWDAASDTARTRFGCSAALFILASIPFFFLAANSNRLFAAAGVALLIAGILMIVVWSRKKSEDLSDNLRVSVLPFLAALREDFGSEPVAIKLDLRVPKSKEKIKDVFKTTGMMKDVTTTYVDPWMSGEGTLTDGSKLQWSVVDTIIEKQRWRKKASGKYKSKTKTKKKTAVDVTLALKSKRYDVGSFDANDVKRGENKNVVSISHKIAREDANPTPHGEILQVIAGVYRELRPA